MSRAIFPLGSRIKMSLSSSMGALRYAPLTSMTRDLELSFACSDIRSLEELDRAVGERMFLYWSIFCWLPSATSLPLYLSISSSILFRLMVRFIIDPIMWVSLGSLSISSGVRMS